MGVFITKNKIWVGIFFVSIFLFGIENVFAEQNLTVDATVPAICGNTVVEGAETCDDGNTSSGDGCSNICVSEAAQGGGGGGGGVLPPVARCGDGKINNNEQCDDGNDTDDDICNNACQLAECGDGRKQGLEQCDDGNNENNDGCSIACIIEVEAVCGDGLRENAEQCDDGNKVNNDGCSSQCVVEVPGVCGNGILERGELCDDGNNRNGDACPAHCVIEPAFICGNGRKEKNESCDDGNLNNGDGCNNKCQFVPLPGTVCGNGIQEAGEQCDDNNLAGGDGCSQACQREGNQDPNNPQNPPDENKEPAQNDPQNPNENREGEEGVVDGSHNNSASSSPKVTSTPIFLGVEKDAAVTKNIVQVVKNINENIRTFTQSFLQETKIVSEKINKIADDSRVEQASEQVLAPALAAVVAVSLVPSVASIFWTLLRFVFLQPLLLFGRKKRKEWGQVYNSLTKLPVDLALVRLIDAKTKRIVQSRVTDVHGRYLFIVEPGEYLLEVSKAGFVFPSPLLKEAKSDGKLLDLYHGEVVSVSQDGVNLTPNIPLDPLGENKPLVRLKREKYLLLFQQSVSSLGIFFTLISAFISPVWHVFALLGVQILLYIVFRYFVKPKKPKGWGIVYEKEDKAAIANTVVRLFSKKYNKLVSSQVTDKKGRYAFLVGPNDYYVTFEKKGYKAEKTADIQIPETEEQSILKEDIGLEKQS